MDGSIDIPYGGLYGDCSDYHGWVVGLSAENPTDDQPSRLRDGRRPGGHLGPARGRWSPPDGSLYVATGNGLPVGRRRRVRQRAAPLARRWRSRTASPIRTTCSLSGTDLDLGSTSPALLPGGLVFEIGKQGVGYLMNASHLGGIGGEVASAQICSGGFGGDAVDGDVVLVSCYDGLYAVAVTPANGTGGPALSVRWTATGFRPGPPIVAGGVVWVVETGGTLAGFDLASGRRRLPASGRAWPGRSRARRPAAAGCLCPMGTGWRCSPACEVGALRGLAGAAPAVSTMTRCHFAERLVIL